MGGSWKSGWTVGLLLLLAAAEPVPPTPWHAEEKAVAATKATNSQTGQVIRLTHGLLELTPFNRQSDLTRFWLNPSVPVFVGGATVSVSHIAPGNCVRVDYRRLPDGSPEALAVVVLAPRQVPGVREEAQAAVPERAVVPPGPSVPPTSPMTGADQKRKAQLIARASGSQSGEILSTGQQVLTLRPFHAGGEIAFDLGLTVPVYDGGEEIATSLLRPGADVRVYYEQRIPGARPTVSVVEILSPHELHTFEGR